MNDPVFPSGHPFDLTWAEKAWATLERDLREKVSDAHGSDVADLLVPRLLEATGDFYVEVVRNVGRIAVSMVRNELEASQVLLEAPVPDVPPEEWVAD